MSLAETSDTHLTYPLPQTDPSTNSPDTRNVDVCENSNLIYGITRGMCLKNKRVSPQAFWLWCLELQKQRYYTLPQTLDLFSGNRAWYQWVTPVKSDQGPANPLAVTWWLKEWCPEHWLPSVLNTGGFSSPTLTYTPNGCTSVKDLLTAAWWQISSAKLSTRYHDRKQSVQHNQCTQALKKPNFLAGSPGMVSVPQVMQRVDLTARISAAGLFKAVQAEQLLIKS